MAALNCAVCEIDYPPGNAANCPACGGPRHLHISKQPHPDWVARMDRRRREIGLLETPPRLADPVKIVEDGGLLWVAQDDLIQAGLRIGIDQTFWLFAANGETWEAQGWDEPRRRWWIERVTVTIPDKAPRRKRKT